MPLPKISTFPLDKPFEKQDAKTPLSEIGLRLVVNFYSDCPYVVGTATMFCGSILITARHVLRHVAELENPSAPESGDLNAHLVAIQILPGPEYMIWDVVDGIADPVSDVALLRLGTNPGRSNRDLKYEWRCPRINPFPPEIGERVAAFGYQRSSIRVSKNDAGGNHIDLNDEPIASVGIVREVYEMRRDSLLPFPCYQVSARFAAGMSGGPVFDEAGSLCGLICSNIEGSHLEGEPVSYVTTLWPIFRLLINFDRGDSFPRGIFYQAVDLARGGQVSVSDLLRLEQWLAKHIPLTTGR